MTYSGAILDVDGTVVRGNQALPGAQKGLTALGSRSIRRLFVSNNPTRPPESYAEKLRAAGIDAAPDEILTAATSTVEYLRRHHAGEPVYLVGDPGVREQLVRAGFDVCVAGDDAADIDDVEVAVVSIDRSFDYDTLTAAARTIRGRELPIVGTDPDAVLGKPHEITRTLALERLNSDPAECVVIGDRLDTDIALGAETGMTTVLVRSGVTDNARLRRADVTPDYVIDTLADIGPVLDGVASRYSP